MITRTVTLNGPSYGGDLRADGSRKWKSARFMPRWASRIDLTVIELRAQRILSITVDDVCADVPWVRTVDEFRKLWDEINGERYPWKSNPWAWAIMFARAERGAG